MSIASLTPLVREALGVSSSYDAVSIPAYIKAAAKRLLRDYNFPKSLTHATTLIAAPNATFALPADVGKIKQVVFNDPVAGSWSEPLTRTDQFTVQPGRSIQANDFNTTYKYYQEGNNLLLNQNTDPKMNSWNIVVWYQTINPDLATWIYDDFEDVLRYMTVYREAAALRKPEVQQAFAPLYQEEIAALAIYLNEIEWAGVTVMQRDARPSRNDRYPAS